MLNYFKKSKRRGAALILEAIIALTVVSMTAAGLFYNNVSMYSGFDSYRVAVAAQMQAESKASEIKILPYTEAGTAAEARAAVPDTPFEREVLVGAEVNLGNNNKKRDITVNVYKPGETQTRASLPVTLTSQGSSKPDVAILTGTIYHGEQIPLPEGYTQDQCQWLVSTNAIMTMYSTGGRSDRCVIQCFADENRIVTVRLWADELGYVGGLAHGVNRPSRYSANYIIVGVK